MAFISKKKCEERGTHKHGCKVGKSQDLKLRNRETITIWDKNKTQELKTFGTKNLAQKSEKASIDNLLRAQMTYGFQGS